MTKAGAKQEVPLMTDSLLAAVTGLGGRPLAGKLVEEAGFGAEDIGRSLFLEGGLAVHHDLLAAGAGHLHRLSCRRSLSVFVAGCGGRWGWRLLAVAVVITLRLTADR